MNKRSKFLRAAEKLEYKGLYSRSFAEPFPDWFEGVALRFARVFVPELRFRDVVENPERFFGYVAGYAADLLDRAKNVKLSEIPRGKNWKLVRKEILAIRKNGPANLRRLKRAVAELPRRMESEFYDAYAQSVRKNSTKQSLQRLEDSNTAKICFFLLCMRPHIEARKFRSVSELVSLFIRMEELDSERKRFLKESDAARRSLEGQFRDICSEDGLKLRTKGRPRKILSVGT